MFGYIFNDEKLNKTDVLGVVFSLLGVIIVSDPGLLGFPSVESDEVEYPHFNLGCCSAIAGAMSSAGAYVWMRRIGSKVHTCLRPMYFGIFSTITCILIQGSIEILKP